MRNTNKNKKIFNFICISMTEVPWTNVKGTFFLFFCKKNAEKTLSPRDFSRRGRGLYSYEWKRSERGVEVFTNVSSRNMKENFKLFITNIIIS